MSDNCPLCGGGNACEALKTERPTDCWCFHTSIPRELLALIPPEERGKACVCAECVKRGRGPATASE